MGSEFDSGSMSSATEQLGDSTASALAEDGVPDVNAEAFPHRARQCVVPVLILLVVVAIVFVGTGWYGFGKHGSQGLLAALVAGLVCFLSASAALVATSLTANSPNAVSGILFGIILRTAFPLFASILLMQAFKPLADAGLLGMVLVNYLVVLAAETLLAVRIVQANSSKVDRQ